jgi:hypothetical protein
MIIRRVLLEIEFRPAIVSYDTATYVLLFCYGMSSVKWLTRIQAVREPFHGYWNTSDYAYCEPPRVCRRPFGLSYAAMAGCSSMA